MVTFVVERTDERDVKPSLPGQYVTIKMLMKDGVHQPRQYSLTRADDGQHRQFAVKRVHGLATPDGEMSNLLHQDVNVGDEVVLSAPFGDVVLEYTDRPVVMASAGIGITPMAGMLSHLVKAGSQRQVMLLHADDSPESFPLRQQVTEDIGRLAEGIPAQLVPEPGRDQGAAGSTFSGFMDVNAVELPHRCRVLPLRPAAVPAGSAERPHRQRRSGQGHPVRGVRPGPLAGRLPVIRIRSRLELLCRNRKPEVQESAAGLFQDRVHGQRGVVEQHVDVALDPLERVRQAVNAAT